MIDLRFRGLPSRIQWDGGSSPIKTDFRTWIEFERRLREEGTAWFGIFPGAVPDGTGWVLPAIEFLRAPEQTPRDTGHRSGSRSVDMVLDGSYIAASFQQAYGIDLTDKDLDLHWHRFKALLDGLPDDTKLSRIVSYRTWDPRESKRKYEDSMREMKAAWALPTPESDEEGDGGWGALVDMFDK